jgi:hypothetical protein
MHRMWVSGTTYGRGTGVLASKIEASAMRSVQLLQQITTETEVEKPEVVLVRELRRQPRIPVQNSSQGKFLCRTGRRTLEQHRRNLFDWRVLTGQPPQ